MDKKLILISLSALIISVIVILLFNNPKENNTIVPYLKVNKELTILDDQSLKKDAYFKLGLTRDDVYELLKELNYEIKLDEEFENGAIWCESINFTFDKDNKVVNIFANDSAKYVTTSGIKIGDDVKKVIKSYGEDYYIYPELEMTIYEYQFKDNYFQIAVSSEEGIVKGFGISRDKYN